MDTPPKAGREGEVGTKGKETSNRKLSPVETTSILTVYQT